MDREGRPDRCTACSRRGDEAATSCKPALFSLPIGSLLRYLSVLLLICFCDPCAPLLWQFHVDPRPAAVLLCAFSWQFVSSNPKPKIRNQKPLALYQYMCYTDHG